MICLNLIYKSIFGINNNICHKMKYQFRGHLLRQFIQNNLIKHTYLVELASNHFPY
jgi:hypothetical protein